MAIERGHQAQIKSEDMDPHSPNAGTAPLSLSAFSLDPSGKVGAPLARRESGGNHVAAQAEREAELQRLSRCVETRGETIELIKKWGDDGALRGQEQAMERDISRIVEMEQSAVSVDQAIWKVAEAKASYRTKGPGSLQSRSTVQPITSEASVVGAATQASIDRRREVRRRKLRKQQRLWKEEAARAQAVGISYQHVTTAQYARTIHADELQKPAPKSAVVLSRDQSVSDVIGLKLGNEEDAKSHIENAKPKPMHPPFQGTWTPRRQCYPTPDVSSATLPPLTPRNRRQQQFMEWQRRRVNQQSSMRSMISPRHQRLHEQVAQVKTAAAQSEYAHAAKLVNECILEHPKVTQLYALRSLVAARAATDERTATPERQQAVLMGAAATGSRHELLQQALYDAETVVASRNNAAHAHARRGRAQHFLGDGWHAAAAKSMDEALRCEPADKKRTALFRAALSETARDRGYQSVQPPFSSKAKLESEPPEARQEKRVEPPESVPSGYNFASQEASKRGLRLAETKRPRLRNTADWDLVGVTDLVMQLDTLRVAIIAALDTDEESTMSRAQVDFLVEYLHSLCEFKGTSPPDKYLLGQLRTRIHEGCGPLEGGHREMLEVILPPPAHEDWNGVLNSLQIHALTLKKLFHHFHDHDDGAGALSLSMSLESLLLFSRQCRVLGSGNGFKLDADTVDRIFVRSAQDSINSNQVLLEILWPSAIAQRREELHARSVALVNSKRTNGPGEHRLHLMQFVAAVIRMACIIYQARAPSLSSRLDLMLQRLDASNAAKGISDPYDKAAHSAPVQNVLQAFGPRLRMLFSRICAVQPPIDTFPVKPVNKAWIPVAPEESRKVTRGPRTVTTTISTQRLATKFVTLDEEDQFTLFIEGLPTQAEMEHDTSGGLDGYEQKLQALLSQFGPVHAATVCSNLSQVSGAKSFLSSSDVAAQFGNMEPPEAEPFALVSFANCDSMERACEGEHRLGLRFSREILVVKHKRISEIVAEVITVHRGRVELVTDLLSVTQSTTGTQDGKAGKATPSAIPRPADAGCITAEMPKPTEPPTGKHLQVMTMGDWLAFVTAHGVVGTKNPHSGRDDDARHPGFDFSIRDVRDIFLASNGSDLLRDRQLAAAEYQVAKAQDKEELLEYNEFEECIVRLASHQNQSLDSDEDEEDEPIPVGGAEEPMLSQEIAETLQRREQARIVHDFILSDRLRESLRTCGVVLNDRTGTWRASDGRTGTIGADAPVEAELCLAGKGLCDADMGMVAQQILDRGKKNLPDERKITYLDLSKNAISDAGCAVLAPVFSSVRSLRLVNLGVNAITEKGRVAIFRALALGRHRCDVMLSGQPGLRMGDILLAVDPQASPGSSHAAQRKGLPSNNRQQRRLDHKQVASQTEAFVIELLKNERMQAREITKWNKKLGEVMAMRQQQAESREERRRLRRDATTQRQLDTANARKVLREDRVAKQQAEAAFREKVVQSVLDRLISTITREDQQRQADVAHAMENQKRALQKGLVEAQMIAAKTSYEEREAQRLARWAAHAQQKAAAEAEIKRQMKLQLMKEQLEAEEAHIQALREERRQAAIMEVRRHTEMERDREKQRLARVKKLKQGDVDGDTTDNGSQKR